ncbi:MAG: hypothetical protein ACR2NF_11455 [Pirellulales bacterium]
MKKCLNNWDHVFIFGTTPTPRMLDRVRVAIHAGCRVAVVVTIRQEEHVQMEEIQGCDIFFRRVGYKGVSLLRLFALPHAFFWLQRNLRNRINAKTIIHTDCLDLLSVAQIVFRAKGARYHHQVRDLHALQMGKGLASSIVRTIDKKMMHGVSMLMLTCQRFYDDYYKKIYNGKYVIVENWPDYHIWENFKRRNTEEFVIAYIGIVRYLDCLKALIASLDSIQALGHPVRLKLAGGGDTVRIKEMIGSRKWIDFTGPFSYVDEVLELYEDVDLIWSVYDTSFKNVQLAMPNKFYESKLARIPIIVASQTYLSSRVHEDGIGIDVECTNSEDILIKLLDALKGSGWYQLAIQNLSEIDAEHYLTTEHPKRIRTAIFGPEEHPKTTSLRHFEENQAVA